MKPNFALSLSFDGIRLMHRASGGWRLVGEVDVASDSLTDELAVLRKTASDLQPGRVRSKLIIPDDQIRYLTIETGPLDHATRIEAARAALNGATPYPVDALSFDISEDGDTTYIAAVARETLAEAEAFASEHRFHPVSFVAAPVDKPFFGEPFFGPSAHASTLLTKGEVVEADGVRVVIVGTAKIPDGPVAADDVDYSDPVSDHTHDTEGSAPESDAPKKTALAAIFESDVPAPEDAWASTELPTNPDPAIEQVGDKAAPDPVTAQAPIPTHSEIDVIDPATSLEFASRRGPDRGPGARPLGGVTRAAPAKPAPAKPADTDTVTAPPPLEVPKASSDSLNPDAGPDVAALFAPMTLRTEDIVKDGTVGFLSRRKPYADGPAPYYGTNAATPPTNTAAAIEHMSPVAENEQDSTGAKPRYLSLILTIILIVFLAGVAAWASVFFDDRLSWLFQGRERTLASTLPDDVAEELAEDVGVTISVPTPEAADTPDDSADVAALSDGFTDSLTAEDTAVLDALPDPRPAPAPPEEQSAATQEARYAITGVWTISPVTPDAPELISLEDLYVTSIDPVSPALDAIAMQGTNMFQTDAQLAIVTSPAAPGTSFTRDLAGRVVPTVQGALSPDGFTVFLGRPPIVPPPTPLRFESDPTIGADLGDRLQVRPRARPSDLVEQNERATLGGLSLSELSGMRPRLRPYAPQELAEQTKTEANAPVSPFATAQSLRPSLRPKNFDRVVARAERRQSRASTASLSRTQTVSVAPRSVKPAIPSSASVAKEATIRNAMNLRRVNLIGVYGSPSDRRALVRLGNGRYQKVQVGDRFDGGRVSAIGDSELRYQKSGRNVVLKIPKG